MNADEQREEIGYALDYNPSPHLSSGDAYEIVRFGGHSPEGGGSMDIAAIVRRESDGHFLALEGGCDYTGWDCQSSLDVNEFDSADEAWRDGITEDGRGLILRAERGDAS